MIPLDKGLFLIDKFRMITVLAKLKIHSQFRSCEYAHVSNMQHARNRDKVFNSIFLSSLQRRSRKRFHNFAKIFSKLDDMFSWQPTMEYKGMRRFH